MRRVNQRDHCLLELKKGDTATAKAAIEHPTPITATRIGPIVPVAKAIADGLLMPVPRASVSVSSGSANGDKPKNHIG